MRKRYDEVNHCCPTCKTLMNKNYYIKHHTQKECFVDEFHMKERSRDVMPIV